METVDAGTISKNGDSVSVRFRRTVHGPVVGYARVAGSRRVVALAQKRSSAGRETTDQIFFRDLTFGGVKSAQGFIRAAAATPQTFNSFYADDKDIAFVTTGRLPLRPRGVNGDLPTDGRGRFEWKGFLAANRHPQAIDPGDGLLVNWNNKPAQGLPGGRRPLGRGRHPARRLAAQGAGADGEAHAGDRARRGERGGHGRPARAHVARRHGDPRQGDGAEPARPGGGRPDHRVERRRRELGRRERRRADRRARAGGDGRGLAGPRRAPRCAAASAPRCAARSRRARAASRPRPAACTAAGTSTWTRTCARSPAAGWPGGSTCATAATGTRRAARGRCGRRSSAARRPRPGARARPTPPSGTGPW